jgi:site-specific DNA-methyltransferase (adenine-specific)
MPEILSYIPVPPIIELMPAAWKNKLYFGDNLEILRKHVPDESVDLVYLDPPFNSKADYNVLFKTTSGEASSAQATAFKDTWEWDEAAADAYHEIMMRPEIPPQLRNLMQAMKVFLTGDTGSKGNSMMAYLTMMALRLVELHRVLKPTGSLYLHCDPTASHYIKQVLDAIFGFRNFRSEIVWKRTSAHSDAKNKYAAVHDLLLFYGKSDEAEWNQQFEPYDSDYIATHFVHSDPDGRLFRRVDLRSPNPRPNLTYDYAASNGITYKPHANGWAVNLEKMKQLDKEGRLFFPAKVDGRLRRKLYLDESPGNPVTDLWSDIKPIFAVGAERLGYPTQKPETLLERVVRASSAEGEVVLDPFCGCGTTIAVAEKLKRRWIGIDVAPVAVDLMERRLLDMFSAGKGANSLANIPVQKRRHAMKAYWEKGEDELGIGLRTGLAPFEVLGVPTDLDSARFLADMDKFRFEWWCVTMVAAQGKEKKGADKGIDGIIPFQDKMGDYKKALVSVKGGANIKREMIATLKGDMEREGAISGILITLEEPTGPMKREAADAGRWNSEMQPNKSFPKIQILTVAEILAGEVPDIPRWGLDTFKQAQRVSVGNVRQESMDM